MRIILFHPRGRPWQPGRPDVHSLACVLPPLGLASLAAVLRSAGHEVTILDAALCASVTNEEWARRIATERPDLVGFTATTSAFLDAYDVCEKTKDCCEAVLTVFGGVHVSWGRDLILRKFPAVDVVVAGEGEPAILALAEGTAPSAIDGVFFRDGPGIEPGAGTRVPVDLDKLPFPALDLLEGFPRAYALPLFGYPRHPGVGIASSRGCTYQCSFCDRSVFGRSFRANSAEYTFEQIRWLRREFGIRHVNFYDDLFTLNRRRIARLCELLARNRPGVTFNCIVRVGHIDDELIAMLRAAGCWMVNIGIESGDQAILDSFKDGLTIEAIRRDVERIHAAGIWVKGLFMMGFPGETESSIVKTRDFALSLPLKDANVTAFTPFPGAPVAKDIGQYGEVDDNWSKMDCEQFVFVPHTVGSREILERRRGEFIRGFYQRPWMRGVYRRMLFESPHSYWRLIRNLPSYLGYARGMGPGRTEGGRSRPDPGPS